MKVIILANGLGTRWISTPMFQGFIQKSFPGDMNYELFPPKQLLKVGNKYIIQRTIEQIKKYISKNILVSAPGIICQELVGVDIVSPRFSGELLSGILQLHKHWDSEGTIFLLGDVVFSIRMINAIASNFEKFISSGDTNDVIFFGREGKNIVTGKKASELFGFIAGKDSFEWIKKTCRFSMNEPKGSGKLWNLLRNKQKLEKYLYQCDGDYTDDCDSPEEYLEFWSKLSLAAEADDKNNLG